MTTTAESQHESGRTRRVTLRVNGGAHTIDVEGGETLLAVLRDRLGLTGTKLACGRGECGACTVLVADAAGRKRPVYSCLSLAASRDNADITTIEGLAAPGLHPLQQAFIAHDAVQCGFCTPGQLLAAVALLEGNASPTDAEIRAAMSGNLCRCGTYPKILLAIRAAAERTDAG